MSTEEAPTFVWGYRERFPEEADFELRSERCNWKNAKFGRSSVRQVISFKVMEA